MVNNIPFNGGSPFRIKRPPITTNGFVSEIDATIKSHLVELNTILGKRVIPHLSRASVLNDEIRDKEEKSAKADSEKDPIATRVHGLLSLELTPKKIPSNTWAENSLVTFINKQETSSDKLSLAGYIDMTSELSTLKYAIQNDLSSNWFNLDENTKSALNGYPAILDYLIAYGFSIMGLREINGLKNFIFSNGHGIKNVFNYAIVTAARTLIDKEQIKVPDYNDDKSKIVEKLKTAGLSLSAASFQTKTQALIDDFIFNSNQAKILEKADIIGVLPAELKPLLIKQIKQSPIPITEHNINFFLPVLLQQVTKSSSLNPPEAVDVTESDKDFDVEFLTDDTSLIQVSVSAVKCAAQLYYGMILGDELDVFNIVNYFTHKYLIRGGIEIQDTRLRDDLQMYVFSNRFTDLKTHNIIDRTRPPERHMFYRQVFNYGKGQVTDDLIVNTEWTKLWNVLILESAKYLERAQASFNPDSYVSRQNVMQAVEDIQYNLSTHCTGMANVITPMIYAELNFVVQRIFMHPEILRQVVPSGGTWWRVVETLYMGLTNTRPKATVLYNKAKLGFQIIRSIAEYNPATFEDDVNFSAFISSVDAYITTQSILQDAVVDDLKKSHVDEENDANEPQQMVPQSANGSTPPSSNGTSDEWDF